MQANEVDPRIIRSVRGFDPANPAARVSVRQGYPFTQAINIASRPNRAGGVAVLLDPPGDIRYPTFKNVDLHVDRELRVGRVTLSPAFDVFNLFNADTVMARRTNQNAANANQTYGILQGPTGRIGLVVTF